MIDIEAGGVIIVNLTKINWKLFFRRVYQKTFEVELFVNAMSLVYTTLLSIIPLLMFSFYLLTLFNFFGNLNSLINQLKQAILTNLATGTGETVINFLETHVTDININQLGIISFISLVLIIVFLLARIEKTFNKIWGVDEHRDLFKRFVSFWTFVTLGTFLITLTLSITLTVINSYLSSGLFNISLEENVLFKFISFTAYFLIFIVGYYLIPNTEVEPLAAVVGGVFAGSMFQLAKNLYTFYAANVVTYSKLYGSLAVVPLFLVWLYLIWLIALLGAVICYVFQHRESLYFFTGEEEIKPGLRLLLPLALLLVLHKNFINSQKVGVTLEEFINRIKLPAVVIEEELERLQAKNLLAKTRENKYLLLTPLDELLVKDIYEGFIWPENLEIERVFTDEEICQLYYYLQEKKETSLADQKVADLL